MTKPLKIPPAPPPPPHPVRVTPGVKAVLLELEGQEIPLPALAALLLSGKLLAAALQVIATHHGGAGPFQEGEASVYLWEKWGDAWNPTLQLRTVEEIEKEVMRVRSEGIPYMVALELTVDPLDPKPFKPKEASR